MDPLMIAETLASGVLIGFVLGLVGGGGSILAVPLLVYFVGVDNAHQAIGTAAVAVALNAAIGLFGHARARNSSGTARWSLQRAASRARRWARRLARRSTGRPSSPPSER